jgi:hypothetical protein
MQAMDKPLKNAFGKVSSFGQGISNSIVCDFHKTDFTFLLKPVQLYQDKQNTINAYMKHF